MKSLFNRLTFPVKLVIIGLVPLIFLIYVSFEVFAAKNEKIVLIDKFLGQIDDATALSVLVDQLQTERRYTFGYMINTKWESNMMIQRAKTDEYTIAAQQSNTTRLKNLKAHSILDQLPDFRKKVSSGGMNAEEVMEFYTNVILRLNTLSTISTENVAYLEPLNSDLRGQRLLSQMITYVGILRSTIYQAMVSTQNSQQTISQIRNGYLYFNSLEQEFLQKSSTGSVANYKTFKKGEKQALTFNTIEEIVDSKKIPETYDAETWWEVSASSMEEFKVLQRSLLSEVEVKARKIASSEISSKNKNLFVLILIVVLVITIISLTITNISKILTELKIVSEKLAMGVTGNEFSVHTNDVIGKLARAIITIDKSNVQLSRTASEIGRGNFEVKVTPRSADDILGNAVVLMRNNLQRYTLANDEKIWLQAGLSAMNDSTRGQKDILSLTNDSLTALINYSESQTGLFYAAEGTTLSFSAGYAIQHHEKVPQHLGFGDGLLGHAAQSRQIAYLDDVPDEYVKVLSATGSFIPRHIAMIPLMHNNEVEGVIELASIKPFNSQCREFFEMMSQGLAISLQAAKSRMKLKELLEETQAQSEELQVQHNEMESLNAELEMQAQKLQASEEELRVQQEELQQTNGELEERGSLLEEKNIEIQRKAEELEQTTRYKSEFLANVSHELRTPLNSILLLSRLLYENSDKNLNDEQIEFAKVIQSSGSGLLGLIDEILDLSKIEAGKMALEFSECTLKEITDDMEALFKNLAKEKGVDFVVEIDKTLPLVIQTDKGRLEQILKNLISNALKFTSKGSVRLSLKPNKSKINFVVEDTGIGISKEKQHLVFEAFQQADGSTKRKYGGTGLGLSISRELVKLLGGEIRLSSEPEKGSVFTLEVPIVQTGENTEAVPVVRVAEKKEEKTEVPNPSSEDQKSLYLSSTIPESVPDDRAMISAHDKVILIIEDDTNFAKSLLEYTRKQGYKGVVAVRGDDGLKLALEFKPLGILLDIQLPVKSGWEVMDDLKGNPSTRHIPVHMMSSLHMKNESLLKGAVDFIDKPVAFEQMQEIFKKIEYVLERKSKKVLIIEENSKHAKALAYFLETFNVNAELKSDISEGVKSLQGNDIDCVILDMGIPDLKAYETLEEMKKNPGLENLPIIVFTGKSLSKAEETRIKKYADSIIVKTAHSYQRVLDEISLFLHMVEDNKPEKGRNANIKKLGGMNDVLNNKTVLIVDDDVRNVFSLSKALEKFKINVVAAVDGKEALQKLKDHKEIDLVLLDMMMPEMDGYETSKRIRQNPAWKDLPVIAVTAKAMTGDREKCIQAGSSDYITKPVDIDQLISLLRVWLYERM